MPAYPLAEIKHDGSLVSYGPGAYMRWIFCGGLCASCRKPTNRAIFDFVFNLRACSRKCEDELIKRIPSTDWSNLHQKEPWGTWLLRKLHEYSIPTNLCFIFNGCQIAAAKAEYNAMVSRSASEDNSSLPLDFLTELSMRAKARPALQKNGEELQRWWAGYAAAKSEMSRTNYAFVAEFSQLENLSMKKMMRTQTLVKVFSSFNRDLEPLTDHVWIHYRDDILAELQPKTAEDAKPPVNEKFRCEYCPRSFTPEAMLDHLVAMHKDQNPDAFASKPARMVDRTHCRQCAHSNRVYTEQGLRAHILAKLVDSKYEPHPIPICRPQTKSTYSATTHAFRINPTAIWCLETIFMTKSSGLGGLVAQVSRSVSLNALQARAVHSDFTSWIEYDLKKENEKRQETRSCPGLLCVDGVHYLPSLHQDQFILFSVTIRVHRLYSARTTQMPANFKLQAQLLFDHVFQPVSQQPPSCAMSMDSTVAYVADVLAQDDEFKAEYQVELNDPAWLAEQKTTNRRVEILRELKERNATMLAYLDKVTKERAERAATTSSSKRALPNDDDSTEPKPKRFKFAAALVGKVKAKAATGRAR
uniref:C2H2-type domain-containing protein n=1 Tax=Mycena chlorophos TaxID=658473 RepID=A0ABQ0LRL4_MYCCL|nr:predicted protein [Mycena chlorophos]